MKKAFAILTAGAMTASLSLSVSAATIVPDNTTGNTTVKYQVNPSYIVEIPAEVTLKSDQAVTDSLKIYGEDANHPVLIASNQEVQVSVNGSSAFSVTYADDTLEYDLTVEDTVIAPGDQVASARSNQTAEKTLSFSAPKSTAVYAGEYTGAITFDVTLATV